MKKYKMHPKMKAKLEGYRATKPKPSSQNIADYLAGGHILGELILVECAILSQRNTLRSTIEHLEALNRRVEKIRIEIAGRPQ